MKSILFIGFLALSSQQTSTQNNNGTIEGNVVRYGTAEGIANVEITLTPEGEVTTFRTALDYGRVLPEAVTDPKGHFILRNVSPGKYRVSATSSWFDTTYFPGVRDVERATALNISEAEVRDATDFVMQTAEKTYKVSGKVLSRNSSLADARFSEFYLVPRGVLIPKPRPQDSNGGQYSTGVFNSAKTGDARQRDFAFDGVRSGDYDLFAEMGRGATANDCCDIVGRVSLHVAGQDVEGVTIEIGGVDVRGQIVVANSPAATPTASLRLALIPEDIRTRQVKPDAAGAFTVPAVLSGAWKVLISGLPPEWAVSDIRVGPKSVYEDGLTVEDRTPELLQVMVSPAGTIEGIVRDLEQGPVAAAQIVLVPISSDSSIAAPAALNRRITSDASGRFTLASVVAGRYAIFAFLASANPERPIPDSSAALQTFLAPFEALGTAVTVNAGTASLLELTPIR